MYKSLLLSLITNTNNSVIDDSVKEGLTDYVEGSSLLNRRLLGYSAWDQVNSVNITFDVLEGLAIASAGSAELVTELLFDTTLETDPDKPIQLVDLTVYSSIAPTSYLYSIDDGVTWTEINTSGKIGISLSGKIRLKLILDDTTEVSGMYVYYNVSLEGCCE